MALLTQKNVGGNTVSSSSATLSETISTIDHPANYTTDVLAVPGLPNIVFRFLATTNPPGEVPEGSYTVTFEAAVRTLNGQPDFKKIVTILPPSSDPSASLLYSFEYPCIAVRAVITNPSDLDPTWDNSYTYVLSAYGP